jgi:hypothetical protein
MTKEQIIAKTITDLSCPPDYLDVVTAELRRRLPDQAFKTCSDFAFLPAKCCETCHTFYAHYDMELIQLQGGGWAWICCSVCDAISSYDSRDLTDKS